MSIASAADFPTIQDGIDHVARNPRGGTLHIPADRVWDIDAPLVLPRTGVTPTRCVALVGEGARHSVIRGTARFPVGRALIEWEPVVDRAWHQHIAGLNLVLPDVPGTRAIHYARTNPNDTAALYDERLQLVLDDLLIEGNNAHHDTAIRLEGQVFYSSFHRVFLDCRRGATLGGLPVHTDHQTVLFHVDDSLEGRNVDTDVAGLSYSRIVDCRDGLRRGGRSALFTGRAKNTRIQDGFSEGGRHRPGIYLRNSFNVTIDAAQGEGRAASHIVVEDSHSIDLIRIFPSSQVPESPEWAPCVEYGSSHSVVATGWHRRVLPPGPDNNAWYRVVTPGTSGSVEPEWPTGVGATVEDGSVTWECMGPSTEDIIVIDRSQDVTVSLRSPGRKPTATARGVHAVRVRDSQNVELTGSLSGNPEDEVVWENSTGHMDLRDSRTGNRTAATC